MRSFSFMRPGMHSVMRCLAFAFSKGGGTLIVCAAVDDHMGMSFHDRRQSQDCLLRQRLLELSVGSRLLVNHNTAKQFQDVVAEHLIVDDDFLENAGEDDFCFVEDLPLETYQNRIKKIFLFHWNRAYPADTYFDIPLIEDEWKLVSVLDFAGNSHKKITMEEWDHEENVGRTDQI